MKITKKHILGFLIISTFFLVQAAGILITQESHVAQAGTSLWDTQQGLGKPGTGSGVIGRVGFSKSSTNVPDIRTVVARIIRFFLGFLGIIFLGLIVFAGFKWMNSRGNEKAVEDAKGQIQAAVIGLLIVVASYGITYLVMQFALDATYDS
ncbi:MAG: hypothetical protein Q7T50_03170 [Candidatus Magasanikbacteria bacterium]|nr:hypothetical protein [Candidatus Magasanikbacteria bacterium]